MSIINPAMLILELRNVIRFGRRNEYLILLFARKFVYHMYTQCKVNRPMIYIIKLYVSDVACKTSRRIYCTFRRVRRM